jgi:hypothetical protein
MEGCVTDFKIMEDRPREKKDEDDEPDFYMENGFVVFTASFLRKRGYCCRNGCRHCPYGFKKAGDEREKNQS